MKRARPSARSTCRDRERNERFYDFYTREEYAPGQTIEVPVDIASIPLFVRSGAILPMSGNKLHNLMTEKTTALDILMAPDVDSEFTLYEDDGRTNDYRKGAYLKTKIAVKAGVKTVVTSRMRAATRPPSRACTSI